MKFAHRRTAVAGTSQSSLLDETPISIVDTTTPPGQRAQVEAVMSDGFWRTIPALAQELKRRFNTRHAETAISARIRDMRRKGFKVECERTRPGSGLYQYRAIRDASVEAAECERAAAVLAAHRGLPSVEDLDAVAADQPAAIATGGAL